MTKAIASKLLPTWGPQKLIKMDNELSYTSRGFQLLCDSYDILHKMGIPFSPQGQAIVEQAH